MSQKSNNTESTVSSNTVTEMDQHSDAADDQQRMEHMQEANASKEEQAPKKAKNDVQAQVKAKGAAALSWGKQGAKRVKSAWQTLWNEERKAAMKKAWSAVCKKGKALWKQVCTWCQRLAKRIGEGWKKLASEERKQAVKAKAAACWGYIVKKCAQLKHKVSAVLHNMKEKETDEGLRTYKLFYISDYEKEAAYLRSMSLKGYHFVRNDGFSFEFVKGDPKNYFYLLDYYKVDPSQEELAHWQQQGWEDIFHAPVNYEGSWHFFRRELKEGDMLEYNENNDSRLELFERLTRNWQGILSVVALCTVFSIVAVSMQIALRGFPWMIALCLVLAAICVCIFLIYLNMYYRTRLRIVDIHNARRQKEEFKKEDEASEDAQ